MSILGTAGALGTLIKAAASAAKKTTSGASSASSAPSSSGSSYSGGTASTGKVNTPYTEYIAADQGLSDSQRAVIQSYREQAKAGNISWDEANKYANDIRTASGAYRVDKRGNVTSSLPSSDLSNYINQIYEAQAKENEARLQSTYLQNAAELEANQKKIAQNFQDTRNQTAAQNDLAQQSFNEYAAARGLNTGTSGQAQIAQNAALQSGLTNIGVSEAQALSDNDLAIRQLTIEYNNAINEAKAAGDLARAQALYQEFVRQMNQRDQNAQFQQSTQAAAQSEARQYAYKLAMAMIESGILPDTTTLSQAGILLSDAQAMVALTQAQMATAAPYASPSSGGGGGGYDNQGLTSAQVRELQNYYGASADGLWGAASSEKAGGLSASEAWDQYQAEKNAALPAISAQELLKQISSTPGLTEENKVSIIRDALNHNRITAEDADMLLDYFGYPEKG